jgi:ferric-dicitrate binding protein FerR (iron transport regulator)
MRWWPATALTGLAALVVAGFFTAGWMAARRIVPSQDVAYTTYSTQNAQIAHVTLGDGTRVTLAPNTTFGVSRDFATTRDVQLSGQAYFEVAAAAHAPFLVHTGTVTTRVLGTRFDVRRYTDDRATRVVVLEGKVAVAGQQGVTLAAGGLGRVSDSTAIATTVDDAPSYAAWTTGGLSFRDVPATELLDVVGHWYGLEFRTTDSALVRQPIVAQLKTGETRIEALNLIEKLLGATLTFTKTSRGIDVVLIAPRRAAQRATPEPLGVRDPLIPHVQEVGR